MLLKSAYNILDYREKRTFQKYISSVDKTYLNLNHLNFLSELSKFAIELNLDDLHQIGYFLGTTLQSLLSITGNEMKYYYLKRLGK